MVPPACVPSQTPALLRLLLPWYFLERPRDIARTYLSYAAVFSEVFSFLFLLRTLFSPWKNIRDSYPNRGFNLTLILQAWTFNIVTRAIGAVIRLGAIIIGIALQLLLLGGFLLYLVLWLFFPLFLGAGLLSLLGLI